jgi:hypothetical protein
MPIKSWWIVASGLVLLAGCASPTPYQPVDGGFGYAEQQIEDNRYRVTFAGNTVTPRDQVQNYLLFRAAEVTVESGHDWFRVVDQSLERQTYYHGIIDDPFPGFYDRRRGFYRPWPTTATVTARPIDNYTAYADIVVYQGDKPADDVRAYDAHDVLRRLEPAVVRGPA